MKQKKSQIQTQTQNVFLESFYRDIDKIPKIEAKDTNRSLRAIMLLVEHIRAYFYEDRSAQSIQKIQKYAHHLRAMESCNQYSVQVQLRQAVLRLLDDAQTHACNLNGLELSLCMEKSQFSDIRESAHMLMQCCLSRQVRSDENLS